MPSVRRAKRRDFSLPLRIEQLVKRTQFDGVAMVIKTSRLLLTAALFGFSAPAFAQEQFATPDAAVDALVMPPDQEMPTPFLRYWGLTVSLS